MMGGPGGRSMGFDRGPAPNTERAPIRSGLQLGLPGRWWDDGKTAKKLGLRSDQQRRMDDIFEANKTNLANLLGNLQREETHLTSLSPSELQDEAKVFAAIDHVAQARADLEKASAHTLLLIRQQMDSSQVATLNKQIAGTR
jgi:Spy/CpxP family protein refolding chaperone